MTVLDEALQLLSPLVDKKFNEFSTVLTNSKTPLLGVKVPEVRKVAKRLFEEFSLDDILTLPNNYYVEIDMIKGYGIVNAKLPIDKKCQYVDEFSKHIDNWSVCDVTVCKLKLTKDERATFFAFLQDLSKSSYEFSVRMAVVFMLANFVDEEYYDLVLKTINNLSFGKYYVDMAVAWLLCEGFIKQYNKTLTYFTEENCKLNKFTFNKAIQKATESFRIETETKLFLKKLKIK